jgi:hypothetical protein
MRVGHVTRQRFIRALLTLAVCAVAALYPVHSYSLLRQTDHLYYTSCDGANLVGEIFVDCDGSVYSWGVTTDFEERDVINCRTGNETITYWECGTSVGGWNPWNICIC